MARKRYKVTVLRGSQALRATTDFIPVLLPWVARIAGVDPKTYGLYRCRDGAHRSPPLQALTNREGIDWCRGWSGKRVRALLAAAALAK